MREENGYYIWNKGEEAKLGKFFKTKEMACKCKLPTCVEQRIAIKLITKMTAIREELAAPLWITSAFRCQGHQESLRASGIKTAVGKSTHELGHAADIRAADMDMLSALADDHFKAIGEAKAFIHVDLRDDKERRWVY